MSADSDLLTKHVAIEEVMHGCPCLGRHSSRPFAVTSVPPDRRFRLVKLGAVAWDRLLTRGRRLYHTLGILSRHAVERLRGVNPRCLTEL